MSSRRIEDITGGSRAPSWPPGANERVAVELVPLLAGPALQTAERWATRVMSRIRGDSRPICGGWPGTVSEARALITEDLLPHLTGESLVEFERAGYAQVARFLYQGAREYWARREHRSAGGSA